jgi:hypothetical protein
LNTAIYLELAAEIEPIMNLLLPTLPSFAPSLNMIYIIMSLIENADSSNTEVTEGAR